jgi:hypothetical protein
MRPLVDPATLEVLRQAGNGGGSAHLRALERARAALERLATSLSDKAQALETRARQLKHQK